MKKTFIKSKRSYYFSLVFYCLGFLFFSSSAFADTVLDNFDTQSYTNNNGTANWAAGWSETTDGGDPVAGNIQIIDDPDIVTPGPYQLRISGSSQEIQREANLTGALSASLTLDYRRVSLSGNEYVTLDVSPDGGTTWFEFDRFQGAGGDATYQTPAAYDISAHISSNTRVRLLSSSTLDSNDAIYFDNIQIDYTLPVTPTHFAISHSGSNFICQNEQITIEKHNADHSIDTTYTGTITLSTSTGNGDWSKTATASDAQGTLTPGASDTGSATYTFIGGDNGTIILNLYNSNTETLNINITDGTDTEYVTEDADLTFSNISPTTYRDNFSTVSYANNDGTGMWAGNWLETTDGGDPALGDIQVTDDPDIAGSYRLLISGSSQEIQREVNLLGQTSATLTLDYRRDVLGNNESVTLEISSNGGGSWTILDTFAGPQTDATYQTPTAYDITAYISNNTRIRFLGSASLDSNDAVFFDNIEVTGNISINPSCLTLDHFSINYSSGATGTGVNCQKESITIAAHDLNHDLYPLYTGTVSLSTSLTNGNWSKTATATDAQGTLTPLASTDDSGAATYEFISSDFGSVILYFADTNPETISLNVLEGGITETFNAAVAADDYDITFSTSAFNFLANSVNNALGIQIGGKRSDITPGIQTLELQASSCESAFTGTTAVEIAVECIEPLSCTGDKLYISTDNGATFDQLDSTPELTYTNILDFDFGNDTDSTAPLIIRYDDVGKIQLHARKTLPPSNVQMAGSSNEFVVRPFAFNITTPSNPAATSAAGAKFTTAGADFAVNVSAVLWQLADDDTSTGAGIAGDGIADGHETTDTDPTNNVNLADNTVALNYGQNTSVEQVQLFSLLDQPAAGNDPGLDDSSVNNKNITSFTSGAGSTSTINYDEVGIIEIYANVSDNDYLGIGSTETAKIAGRSGYVGRFTPHHFDTMVTQGCGTFTYSGQSFGVAATARNLASTATTQNYTGTFAFDTTITNAAVGDTANFNATNTVLAASFLNGTAIKLDIAYTFPAKETVADTITLRVNDADTGTAIGITEGTTEIRSGRIRLENVFGPAISPLTMELLVEFYDGNGTPEITDDGFNTNTDDSCTAYDAPNATLDNYTGNLAANKIDVTGTGTVAAGVGSILFHDDASTLVGPGIGNEGSVNILLDNAGSWLSYDWNIDCDNADGDDDINTGVDTAACGTASFGFYRGDDRIIYWREVF